MQVCMHHVAKTMFILICILCCSVLSCTMVHTWLDTSRSAAPFENYFPTSFITVQRWEKKWPKQRDAQPALSFCRTKDSAAERPDLSLRPKIPDVLSEVLVVSLLLNSGSVFVRTSPERKRLFCPALQRRWTSQRMPRGKTEFCTEQIWRSRNMTGTSVPCKSVEWPAHASTSASGKTWLWYNFV